MKNNNYAEKQNEVSYMDIDYRLEAAQLSTIRLIIYYAPAADCPRFPDSRRVPTWLKWGRTNVWLSTLAITKKQKKQFRGEV